MSLALKAEERKARLAKLKSQSQLSTKRPNENEEEGNLNGEGGAIRFRSYIPESNELKGLVEEAPAIGVKANEKGDTVESRVGKIEKQVQEEERSKNPTELEITNLAPKKPNWDLKRDLDKKLAKLEKATNSAIADLIRQRLKEAGDVSSLAALSRDEDMAEV